MTDKNDKERILFAEEHLQTAYDNIRKLECATPSDKEAVRDHINYLLEMLNEFRNTLAKTTKNEEKN